MPPKPDITVYFLGASRAIRIPWLLEELGLPYELVAAGRAPNGVAPPEFKAQIPAVLKKSPTLKDGDLVVQESGAIVEYILETYDSNNHLLPLEPHPRAQARQWLHAAEGTFMLHALAILYARWKLPASASSVLPELEESLSPNVRADMDWLESTLVAQREAGKEFLVGDGLSVADVMMGFSVEFIFTRKLGVGEDGWPESRAWLARCLDRPAYQKAVERSGYTLESYGKFKT